MDRFKSTAFNIWQGVTMRETPEFRSYRDSYSADWGGVCTVIEALEALMKKYDVQLAIVNGERVAHYAVMGSSSLDVDELIECCLNGEAVRTATQSMAAANDQNQQFRAAILMQSLLRRWKAMRFFREQRERHNAVCAIQKGYRLHFYAMRLKSRKDAYDVKMALLWEDNCARCKEMWRSEEHHPSLLILIPAINAHDYIVRANHFYQEMHNVFYPLLHQLARPNCEVCIITPHVLTAFEMEQVEKLLGTLCPGGGGNHRINLLKERTHFITPELGSQVPIASHAVQNISLAEHLWFSPGALRKIRHLGLRHGNSVLVPSSTCAIHKKLSTYLRFPLLSSDPELAEKLHTRSQSKRLIMKAGLDTPPGTHDIHTQEDVITALSRLISASMDVTRWVIKLNGDLLNEGLCIMDPADLKIYATLRKEMKTLLTMNRGNVGAWFSRPVQLSVRKRLGQELLERLPEGLARLIRTDIFPTWISFLRRLKKYGGVIEADPGAMRLGEVVSAGFISPLGHVTLQGAMDVVDDPMIHTGSCYVYPSVLVKGVVADGATRAVGDALWREHGCFGFFSVRLLSHFCRFENRPRLWGLQVDLGLHAVFGAMGTLRVSAGYTPGYALPSGVASQAVTGKPLPPLRKAPEPIQEEDEGSDVSEDELADVSAVAKPHEHHLELFPALPETTATYFPEALAVPVPPPPVLSSREDRLRVSRQAVHKLGEHPVGPRALVYIPLIFHAPLMSMTDKAFHTSCTQRGLIFNRASRTGVLVLHVGGTHRGNFGMMVLHETRLRAQELAIQALTSIYEFVGKEQKIAQDDAAAEAAMASKKRLETPEPGSRATTAGSSAGRVNTAGSATGKGKRDIAAAPVLATVHVDNNSPPGGFHVRLIRIIGCLKATFKHDMAVKVRGELPKMAIAAPEAPAETKVQDAPEIRLL
jgi:hypothetical protein